jgi:cyanamide hydratase
MSDINDKYGWNAVHRSLDKLIADRIDPQPSKPVKVEDIPLPDDELSQQVMKYAKENLSAETFNHSMRVYYYGSPQLRLLNSHSRANEICDQVKL